jgi:hypothetical protein
LIEKENDILTLITFKKYCLSLWIRHCASKNGSLLKRKRHGRERKRRAIVFEKVKNEKIIKIEKKL